VSFATNTNWQSYGGESTMSYFSQMVGLTIQNFTSAAAGIAIAAALVRGIARPSASTVGNFWTDMVRVTYYLLLPVSLVFALVLVSQGMIQNFQPSIVAKTMESYTIPVAKTDAAGHPELSADGKSPVMVEQVVATQTVVQGPMASQVAIKMLGTNGGGYVNANAAHPYENPDAAFQLSADALHLRDSERLDLLAGSDGEEPAPWLGGVECDGCSVRRRCARHLVG
jgi:K+-transporting ATPase ATPase A chain